VAPEKAVGLDRRAGKKGLVIDGDDLMAYSKKAVAEVGPEEPGTAGNNTDFFYRKLLTWSARK